MRGGVHVAVVIPALNEEASLPHVLHSIPAWVDRVLVVDNGSTDGTADVARANGAHVVHEPRRGYGSACLAGLAHLAMADEQDTAMQTPVGAQMPQTPAVAQVIVFVDADFSDHPEQMHLLVDPIANDACDMVVGSRTLGKRERGALTPQQRFGNALACFLMRLLWGARHTDLGPFRAISRAALRKLEMDDRDFGWTVQMQVRAAARGLRVQEAAVDYRKRIGQSKISGTFKGVILAGTKILYTIAAERIRRSPRAKSAEPSSI